MNTILLWAVPGVLLVVVGLAWLLRRRAPRDHASAPPPAVRDRRGAEAPASPPAAGPTPAADMPATAAQQAAAEALRQARQRAAAETARREAERQAQLRADEQARDQAREQALQAAREQAHRQALLARQRSEQAAARQAAEQSARATARLQPVAPAAPAPLPAPSSAATRATTPSPVAQPPRVAVPAPASAARRPAGPPVVLLADDSKVVRVKTGRLLEKLGCRVLLAEDGAAALQQLEHDAPDLLITDVEMPGVDGFELTRRLRAHARWSRLPVLMITSSDDKHRAEARAAGVDVLLGKPYAEETLLDHVRQRLGARLPAAAAAS